MPFLYLRCEKLEKKFDLYLSFIDFTNYPRNENCRIIFKNLQFDFFILDELVLGISDRIYRIKDSGLEFVMEDIVKNYNYPETRSSSGGLFYDNIVFALPEKFYVYENSSGFFAFYDFMSVEKKDYVSFMRMVEKFKDNETLELKVKGNYDKTGEIFIETGNAHRYIKGDFRPFGFIEVCEKLRNEGRNYYCNDQDALFNVLEKLSNDKKTNRYVIFSISHFFVNLSISENNFRKYMRIAKNAAYDHSDFFEKQIFGKNLATGEMFKNFELFSVLKGSLFSIILEIIGPNFPCVIDLFFSEIIRRLTKGEQMDFDPNSEILFGLLGNRRVANFLRNQLFDITLGIRLRQEKDFKKISEQIKKISILNSREMLNKAMDIMLDNIEISITGIDFFNTINLLEICEPDNERMEKFVDFLQFNSVDEDFLKYTSTFAGDNKDFKNFLFDYQNMHI